MTLIARAPRKQPSRRAAEVDGVPAGQPGARPRIPNGPGRLDGGAVPHGGPIQFEHALQRVFQNSYRTREGPEIRPAQLDNPETLPTFGISDGTPDRLGPDKMVLSGQKLFRRHDSGEEVTWTRVHYGSRVIEEVLNETFTSFVHNNPHAKEIDAAPVLDPAGHPNVAIRTYVGPARQVFVIGECAYLRKTEWQREPTWVNLGPAPMTEQQLRILIALRDHRKNSWISDP